ncbi:PREDICTED: uncharacterized protein LOC105556685 [Vollenhovia emeryi]|uniref:uncharacterized protein LOC105556685 n=1 Tax=Vollenhovia emeryi TaxID=411798 RepID=UPI0005F37581|nr:PREDICTED: uncharacterized protein LOC105556685 [Vollenhovia emeryi]
MQEPSSADEVVASVEQPGNRLEVTDPLVGVKDINEIIGTAKVKLSLEQIANKGLAVNLHVLKDNTFEGDIILGREFLQQQKLTLIFKPSSQGEKESVRLFAQLPLYIESKFPEALEETLENKVRDLEYRDRQRLKDIIIGVHKTEYVPVEDDYEVQVRLKDNSTYSFSPRRFAYAERLQIRAIIDDLLARGIVKTSTSPYCARVVPVRKRSGQMRLCVDLRPLNARVERQRYPFPVIEKCLARLTDRSVFTLLDLKDSFHQIRVHKDSTKYFAFATPDGQYEFNRLPFGFCESPAEFQKRLVQILNPLLRDDKVLVYMDDVLIASRSTEENLEDVETVLWTLKKYGFELNYEKCQFLRKQIEFLGYVISADGITLSPRHTEAVKNFRQPRTVLEVQRFLGLTNYFRRFIKGYAQIAKPIQELVKKDVPFVFDDHCVDAFQKLKRELTSPPVLQLYNPAAPTELHTDACSTGLGGILLQKQKNGLSYLTHRPGKRMSHVDALSRCTAYVHELPLERELELRQLTDPKILETSKKLEIGEDKKFELINDLVYKKDENQKRFVVPDSMIASLIRAHHDEMAHCGAEKTIMGISKNFWFPSMRKVVHDYVGNCLTCVTANSASNRFEDETQLVPLPEAPMGCTWTTSGRCPSPPTDSGTYWWRPSEVVSDRGTAFTSRDFKEFTETQQIKHRKAAVAAPWANGIVERVNRFIKTSLIKSIVEPAEWKTHLGKIQYILNNTHHSSIKATPVKLMLGFDQRNHSDFALAQLTSARHKKPSVYRDGEYVLIKNDRNKPGESAKIKPGYKGPYQIAKVLGHNRYVVKDVPGFSLTQKPLNTILSSDRLKPWIRIGDPVPKNDGK